MQHIRTHNEKSNVVNCNDCNLKDVEIAELKCTMKKMEEVERIMNTIVTQKDIELTNVSKEVDKLEKQKNKLEKDHKKIVKEQKEELQKCYNQVGKYVTENNVLLEEIKTLRKLREVKDKLKEADARKKPDVIVADHDENTNESLDIEDDHVNQNQNQNQNQN